MSDELVTIVTSDGKAFQILREIAVWSRTLRDLMEDAAGDVPLPGVNGHTFEKLVAWCMAHKDDPKEVAPAAAPTGGATEVVAGAVLTPPPPLTEADKTFFQDMSKEHLFEIILAANFLDIKPLLDVCCRVVANSVLGKTPKEIYADFGVTQELTPEEEAEVRAENPWLEDN
jgi:S-phase kinase-associated protein 1